jgi:hypothetical protein
MLRRALRVFKFVDNDARDFDGFAGQEFRREFLLSGVFKCSLVKLRIARNSTRRDNVARFVDCYVDGEVF